MRLTRGSKWIAEARAPSVSEQRKLVALRTQPRLRLHRGAISRPRIGCVSRKVTSAR